MVNTLPSACLRRGARDPWFFSRQRPTNVSNTPAAINRQQRKGFRHRCSPRTSVSPPKTPPRQPPCSYVRPRAAALPMAHLLSAIEEVLRVHLLRGLPMQLLLVRFG